MHINLLYSLFKFFSEVFKEKADFFQFGAFLYLIKVTHDDLLLVTDSIFE